MELTNKITTAYNFAKHAHEDQVRKYTGGPYFTHCKAVATIVSLVTSDEDMICASLLHDVIEDTSYEIDDIEFHLDYEVARLVDGLTDISSYEDGNRAKRKEIDRNHIALGCEKIKTIKLADLIHNSVDIVKNDPKFAETYIAEKKLLMEVLTEGNKDLFEIAQFIIDEYYIKLNEKST